MRLIDADDLKANINGWYAFMKSMPHGAYYTLGQNDIISKIDNMGTVPAISLDRVKQAREEIADRIDNYPDRNISEYEDCLAILDKLISESEGEE